MIYILLPAYNEEEGLEKLLERIKRVMKLCSSNYQIVLVNDGSTDHTFQVAKSFIPEMPIEMTNFEENKGVTEVFRVGFSVISKKTKDEDIVVTMDSDNTHNPYVILDMLGKLESGFDIVIASRFLKGSRVIGVPKHRNLLSNSVAWLLKRLFPIEGIKDYSTFYRAYRCKVLRRGLEKYGDNLIEGDGFSSMANLLLKLSCLNGIRMTEVPFRLRYDLKEGGSKMKIRRTIIGYIKMITKMRSMKTDDRNLIG